MKMVFVKSLAQCPVHKNCLKMETDFSLPLSKTLFANCKELLISEIVMAQNLDFK